MLLKEEKAIGIMGFLLNVGSSIMCPHGGTALAIAVSHRVLVERSPAITLADSLIVAGCPFCIGCVPSPCIMVKWLRPSRRVFVEGRPAILHDSTGICQNAEGIPQGPPIIVITQYRVKGV